MGEREIREKYGGKLPKAINRAIRAEVPGGNEALDKLTQLAGAARHSRWTDHAGRETPEAAAYFKHKREVVDRMDAEVRRRWAVGPDGEGPPRRGHRGHPAKGRAHTARKGPGEKGARAGAGAGRRAGKGAGGWGPGRGKGTAGGVGRRAGNGRG